MTEKNYEVRAPQRVQKRKSAWNLVFIYLFLNIVACASTPKGAEMAIAFPDFDALWNYEDPAGTREKFLALLPDAEESGNLSYQLQLQTQIARTWSLAMGFAEAHKILDGVESSLTEDLKSVRVRYLLERGRTFRSAGTADRALPLFQEAFYLAKSIAADFFTVDAAHMVALAVTNPEDKRKWNLLAMEIAEASSDTKARSWLGSLYNNMGWDYFGDGRLDSALTMFERALAFRETQGDSRAIGIAKWCVARAYRALGRIDEALALQLAILKDFQRRDQKDGYIFEELGELYLIRREESQAKKYFALAYAELSQDSWFVKNEAARLERIKRLGGIS